jgi:hypothetical protein
MDDIEPSGNQRLRAAKLQEAARMSVFGNTAMRGCGSPWLHGRKCACAERERANMLSDSDLQLLNAYLDDALSADEVEELDLRLTVEAELSHTLNKLRAHRAARARVWRASEPSQATAARFATSVLSPLQSFNRGRFASQRSLDLSESEIG